MTFQDLMGFNYKGSDQSLKYLYHKNQQHFEELVSQLKRNAVVPLFGAGFSAAAYPGWSSLLKKMSEPYPDCKDALKQHLSAGEFEEAASLLCEEMGEFEFQEELYDIFGPHTLPEAISKMSEARKAISQIFIGPLVTTNVEQVLEKLYHHSLPVLCPHTTYHQSQTDRALQSSSPILFKLHGDIGDPAHVVFTKESYDAVYQNLTENNTLVRTLKHIFFTKTVLFLGCSLESDRVLKVLERCCDNHVYYALVGLPEETKQKSNPLEPCLLNADGTLKKHYRNRRKFMSDHHIKCIWYPYEQFDALDIFLRELQNRLCIRSKFSSPIPAAVRTIIGRDQAIDTIYQSCTADHCPVFVTGAGGIGKTEVCHMVLRRMEEVGKSILYVNVTSLQEPTTLCREVAQAADAEPLPDSQAVNLPAYLAYLMKKIIALPQAVLYLDNWEDFWYATNGQDSTRLQLLEWMSELCRQDVPVLISSRVYPEEYDINATIYPLPALDQTPGVDRALFQQVYQSKNGHLPLEGASYEKLLKLLDGHPLAIILTATLAAGATSWDSVLVNWTKSTQKTSNPRHTSLDTALQMSWDAVSKSSDCRTVWGLVALCQDKLAFYQLMELADSSAEQQQWEEDIRLLRTASLLDWSQNGTALQMLQPVKEAFFLLAEVSEMLPCFERWFRFYLSILEEANDFNSPNQKVAHIKVVEQLPQIFSLIERLEAIPCQNNLLPQLHLLTQHMLNYFNFAIEKSIPIAEKLINIFQDKHYPLILAHIMKCLGEQFRRLKNLDKAEEMFHQAEILYRQEHDNLGLANIFRSRGSIFVLRNNFDKANELFQQAKTLYLEQGEYLGLANTLQSQGLLFSEQQMWDEAERMLQQAETLFRKENCILGIAAALQEQGMVRMSIGDMSVALDLLKLALSYYKEAREPSLIAVTCAQISFLLTCLGENEAASFSRQAKEIAETLPHSLKEYVFQYLT